MKKFMCSGKYSRYIVAGVLGMVAGSMASQLLAVGTPVKVAVPGLTLALVGTYIYRSTAC